MSATIRIERKNEQKLDEVIADFIREMKLASGLNRQRIYAAWDEASGAGQYTVNRYFRNGVLYCSMSSSVVRNRLSFQKDEIVRQMNRILSEDELFTREGSGTEFVRAVVLK